MNSAKSVIEQVESEVVDIFSTDFSFSHTAQVPNVDDPGLTFANGVSKKGKEINTCVLFVDIRNSVALVGETYAKTMGKIYTVFTKSVLRAAAACGGYVRNIIGDRVMVVFPEDNCFQNAIDCATTINHISQRIINPKVTNHDFSCGIGIDFGKMRCIKVGVEKHGTENSDNKNLVWIGAPANMASRLCDNANKDVQMFKVVHTVRQKRVSILGVPISVYEPQYERINMTDSLTADQFTELIMKDGLRNVVSIEKFGPPEKRKPILISSRVLEGLKKSCPNDDTLVNKLWEEDSRHIRNVDFKVYGSDLIWIIR